jgi:hypothetical protein
MKPRVVLLYARDPRVSFDSGSVSAHPTFRWGNLLAAARGELFTATLQASDAAQCHPPSTYNESQAAKEFLPARQARQRGAHSEEGSSNASSVGFENLADTQWL